MRTFLLVFDDGNGDELDRRGFVDTLDEGAEMVELDDHVCFIRSALPVSDLSDRFLKFAGSRLFYIADVTLSRFTGRLPSDYWDFIKGKSLASAAE